MSRRKHVLQALEEDVEPPGDGQHIVRAIGSRGSNIIEVEFPDGHTTLCLLPAKFHKKLWIKKGNYLIIEDTADADARVTGQILAVLFADHVKQLKRMQGVWPPEFDTSTGAAVDQAAAQLAALGVTEANAASDDEAAEGSRGLAQAAGSAQGSAAEAGGQAATVEECSSSDDDLPPIPKFNNRKVIEYEVSDSESDDD